MSDEELEFHYFQLHDFDKNQHLDGLEILQAIRHTLNHHSEEEEHEETDMEDANKANDEFEYYIELIDRVLQEDDTDQDGFLSYPEYVAGRKRENEQSAKDLESNKDIETNNVR